MIIGLGCIVIGYAAISGIIYKDYKRVVNKYKVKRNGFRFIVRDAKGKFVAMPRNTISGFFTLITLD